MPKSRYNLKHGVVLNVQGLEKIIRAEYSRDTVNTFLEDPRFFTKVLNLLQHKEDMSVSAAVNIVYLAQSS